MLQVESRPSGPPLPYWLPIQEQEKHQADSPFHTRRLPKASHDAAIDGDAGTHVPDNSPPDGPKDASADVRYQVCASGCKRIQVRSGDSSTAVP